MARSVGNGTFSPPLSSATSQANGSSTKLNIVSRLAIEGKARHNSDGANVKLFLKLSIPIESVSPSQAIPLFSEEEVKIRNYQVHPLESDSAPYDFSTKENPLLVSAARALNLPARSSKSYLSLFDGHASSSSRRASINHSVVPDMEQRFSGYVLVSGYNVCFVLPKEFPPAFKSKSSSTESDGDRQSGRNMSRTASKGRRSSILGRPSLQFVVALELWVPFSSVPPKAPYLLSIPIPRCLSNTIRVRLFPPTPMSTSFASLSSDEDSGGWDLATVPHVTRTSMKHSSRANAYSTLADDESSESSLAGLLDNCLVQGTFTCSESISIRWASPLKGQTFPEHSNGRRRLQVGDVKGLMTCTILEQLPQGVKMRLDYQGTCSNLWFPGVATMLGLDVALEAPGCAVSWPGGSDGHWTVDGDNALTGFNAGPPHGPLSRQSSLELPAMTIPSASHFTGQSSGASTPAMPSRSGSTASLLRVPIPSQATTEYSFEDSPLLTPATSGLPSSMASLTPSLSQSSLAAALASEAERSKKPPNVPITLHVNLNELQPSLPQSTFTFNISGTVIVSRASGISESQYTSSSLSDESAITLPKFNVLSAENNKIATTLRNQCDGANVELFNSFTGGSTISPTKNRDKKTVLPMGTQVKCGLEGSSVLLKPLKPPVTVKEEETTPVLTQSRHGSPVPGASSQSTGMSRRLSGALIQRDGPLVLPRVSASVFPSFSDDRLSWSYAVSFMMSTPLDTSEWFNFGLSMPPRHSKLFNSLFTVNLPTVEIAAACIDGVPVRFETYGQLKAEDWEHSALDYDDAEKTTWLTWVRVHTAHPGPLEVTYIVAGELPDDRVKGKKASDLLDLHLFLPQFSLPVARFDVGIENNADTDRLWPISSHKYSNVGPNSFHTFAVEPFTALQLTLRHMYPKKRSRSIAHGFFTLLPLLTLLALLLLTAYMTFHNIALRRDMASLAEIQLGGALSSGPREAGSRLHTQATETVTVTQAMLASGVPTLKKGSFTKINSPTTTVTPALSATVPSSEPSESHPHRSQRHQDDLSSLLPMIYVPFTWPMQLEIEEVKKHVLAGWVKVWKVIEIILHWPLPVPDPA